MEKFLLLLTVFSCFYFFTQKAEAKVLPQAQKGAQGAVVKKTSSGISVSPRLRGDRRAVIVYFANLQNAAAVSYLLTYNTNIQPEGARGSLNLSGSSNESTELLFGTCSKNVCRYHTGIKDAKLEVSYTTKAGKKYLKKYRIKV